MSGVFQTLLGAGNKGGGILGDILGALKGPMTIMDMISKFQLAQKQKAMLDKQIYYAKHPEAVSAMVASMTRPLDQGLVKGVGNIVQAEAGERGLNMAPGLFDQAMAQALAPFQQQEQSMALQEALKVLGIPSDVLGSMQGMGGGGLDQLIASLGTGSGSYKTATPWQDPSTMVEGKPYYPPGSSTPPIFDITNFGLDTSSSSTPFMQ